MNSIKLVLLCRFNRKRFLLLSGPCCCFNGRQLRALPRCIHERYSWIGSVRSSLYKGEMQFKRRDYPYQMRSYAMCEMSNSPEEFSHECVSSLRKNERSLKVVDSSEREKIDRIALLKLKKLLFASLFLLCLLTPFFGIGVLFLFDFISQSMRVFKHDKALQFLQLFLCSCASWIQVLDVVCTKQHLVDGRID